jgi:hypothetical protein
MASTAFATRVTTLTTSSPPLIQNFYYLMPFWQAVLITAFSVSLSLHTLKGWMHHTLPVKYLEIYSYRKSAD